MSNEEAQVRLRNVIDPPCPRHPDTEAIVICQNNGCGEALACLKCVVAGGYHRGHTLTLLQDHLDVCKAKVLEGNNNTREQVLNPLIKLSENVAAALSAYEETTAALLKEIEERGDKLHSQINQLVTEYKANCSQIKASNCQILEQYQRALLAKIAEVKEDITTLDDCTKATCKADIVHAATTGISKTYESIEYPKDVEEFAFQQSEKPLKDMKRLLGRILIGNEQSQCVHTSEETDEEKIKRLKTEIQDHTQREKTDLARMQTLQKSIDELTGKLRDQTKEKIDLARMQTLQKSIDELTGKLRDQTKESENREKELEQKIKELERYPDSEGCYRNW